MNAAVDDTMMLGIAMRKMPSRYSVLMTILCNQDDLTYDHLKDRVRASYQRDKAHGHVEERALLASFSGTCFKCGAYGHRKSECPLKSGNGSYGADRGSQGSQDSRSHDQKLKCRHCKKLGHVKKDCFKLKRKLEVANTAGETNDSLAFAAMESNSGGSAWLLDSGATSHMVDSIAGLMDIKYEAGTVKMAHGKKVASIGSGRMDLVATDVHGKIIKVTLHDMVIVPQLSLKLLSARKIADKGGRVIMEANGGAIEMGSVRIPIRKTATLYEVQLRMAGAGPGQEMVHMVSGCKW